MLVQGVHAIAKAAPATSGPPRPGQAQQRLGVPLAVEQADERRRQEHDAQQDDHDAADLLERVFVLVERRADDRRAEAEQDEDRARSSR